MKKLLPLYFLSVCLLISGMVGAQHSITLGTMPTVCAGATSAALTYTVTSGSGLRYALHWTDPAVAAGFGGSGNIHTIAGDISIGGSYSGDGGAATAAGIRSPFGLTIDTTGNLYISDGFNLVIRKVNTSGMITTYAGFYPTGAVTYLDGVPATDGLIGYSRGIDMDDAGNLYIASFDGFVRKVDAAEIMTTAAGDYSAVGYSGDGGAATAASVSYVEDVKMDAAGNLFICDFGNGVVRKVNTSGIITTFAGNHALSGTNSGDGGPATAAGFAGPNGLAIDAAGNVYISCASGSSSVIRKVSTSGIVTTIAGTGTTGTMGFSGDGGPATAADITTYAIALDDLGNLYMAGGTSVRKVTPSGIIYTVAGGSTYGYSGDGGPATASRLSAPWGITVDKFGDLYVGDVAAGTVRKISVSAALPSSPLSIAVPAGVAPGTYYAVLVVYDATGAASYDTVSVTVAPSAGPILGKELICSGNTSTLSVPTVGGTWTSTNTTVATVGTSGVVAGVSSGTSTVSYQLSSACGLTTAIKVVTVVATPALSFVARDTVCAGDTSASFSYSGTGSGFSYYLSWDDAAIAEGFAGTPSIITTVVGNNSIGATYSGDGGPATAAGLNGPVKAVFDGSGNMFFTELSNGVVRKVTPTGIISTVAGDQSLAGTFSGDGGQATAAGFNVPIGLVVDAVGNLFVADPYNHVVRKVATTGIITTVAGIGSWGYSGDGGQASAAALGIPSKLALDASGNLYIVDENVGVIRKVDPSGIISTVVGSSSASFGYTGDGGPATAAGLYMPGGIAFDVAGNMFIADEGNHVVRKVDAAGIITTVAGNNAIGATYSGDGGPATAAGMNHVTDVAFDAAGNLIIVDGHNAVIRKVSSSGIIRTIAGNNLLGYTGDGGPATAARMITPYSIAVDNTGNIFIADLATHTIRKVSTRDTLSSSPFVVSVPDTASAGTYAGSITVSNGSCSTTYSVSVTVSSSAGSISGSTSVCSGGNTTLSASVGGGTWSSSSASATVSSTGIVSGVSIGTSTISYSLSGACGLGVATHTINVLSSSGAAPISGATSVCTGATISLSTASTGGTWSSSSASATVSSAGIVTGVSVGTATISYNLTGSCGASVAMHTVTVNLTLSAGAISGASTVCTGATITLSTTSIGGTWSSSSANATVSSTGVVSGVSAGTSVISYSLSGICGATAATHTVTINPTFSAGTISGASSVCAGVTISLSTTGSGGAWSSSSSSATVSPSGVVSGVSAGTAIISYSLSSTCGSYLATHTVVINSGVGSPSIAGLSSVTSGSTITLSVTGASGGSWSSSHIIVATVGSSGVVFAMAAGITTISYSITASCGTVTAVKSVTVTSPGGLSIVLGSMSSVCTGTTTVSLPYTVTSGSPVRYSLFWNDTATSLGFPGVGGNINRVAGGGVSFVDGVPATATKLNLPFGELTTDLAGNLYIADGGNHVVRKVNASGIITTIAGNYAAGGGNSGDGGQATAAKISSAFGMTFDASGNLFFADIGNDNVRKINTSGIISTAVGTRLFGGTYSSDGVQATAAVLNNPYGIAFDSYGNLYVSEYSNGIIRKVNSAGIISTYAGNYALRGTNTGDGGQATAAGISNPVYLAFDAAGNLYVTTDHVVRKISTSGIITTVVGNGSAGFSGDGGQATNARLNRPHAIEFDIAGNMYLGETNNFLIRKVTPTGIIRTVAGIDSGGYYGDGGPATAAIMGQPLGMTLDKYGNVYVGESNSLVRRIDMSATIPSSPIPITVPAGAPAGTYTAVLVVYDSTGGSFLDTINVVISPTVTATVSGSSSVCVGNTSTLSSSVGGGTWSSSSSNATVNTSGIVTGVASGTAVISYSVTGSCGSSLATHTMVIAPGASPGTISGSASLCAGATTSLSATGSGGTWSSSSANATVSSAGVVSGVSAGTTIISYAVSSSCGSSAATHAVTINTAAVAGSISGLTSVAPGSTITLSASGSSGGTWSSSSTTTATVSSGLVGGVSAGTATISYSVTNSCGTAVAIRVVSVNLPALGSISGPASFCAGNSATFSHATSGGIWTSSTTSAATIGSSSGIAGGVSGGSTVISYSVGSTTVTTTVTIVGAPTAIYGTAVVCAGGITTLSTTATGGSWVSSTPSVATASTGSLGIVGGVSGGTTTISYVNSGGCASTRTFTVNSLPSAIAGPAALCLAQTATYSNAVAGGSWSTSNPSILYLVDVTGIGAASGGTAGNPIITYTMPGGCYATLSVPVVNLSTPISGTATLCAGSTSLLTHSATSGVWSSSNTAVATTGTGSGLVYGVSSGTTTISYTVNAGCRQTRAVTITASPSSITGAGSVCAGQSLSLSSSVSGGTWSSSATSVVSVHSTTGVATGISVGTAAISYTLGSCRTLTTITVTTGPSAISGAGFLCVGSVTTLSASPSGGAWSSSNLSVATNSGSVVRGVSSGTSLVSYTLGAGCASTVTITVSSAPTPILGAGRLCLSQVTTLSNATPGGRWSSSTTVAAIGSSTGIVTASASLSGYPVISYIMPGGCVATSTVQVLNLAAITGGASSVCVGQSTQFNNTTTGGIWSSTGASVATAGTAGRVTGLSAGATVISYAINTGCARSTSVTVNNSPGITTGAGSICVGTSITLSNPVSGGTWSSLTTSVASVGSSSGIVSGISSSSTAVRIIYTLAGCRDTALVTVNAIPTITGAVSVCASKTITIGASVTGGTWTSGNTAVATVSPAGIVSGVSAGTTLVSYAVGTGCTATRTITVNPYADIVGPTAVCVGSIITMSNAVAGGTWSIYYTTIASIGASTGIVTPIAGSGAVNTITYTMPGGCRDTSRLTVGHSAPITGPTSVCEGRTINLSNIYAGAGGTWSSSTTSVATITTPGAVVSGVAAGVTVITYLLPTGCLSTTSVTVNAAPDAITGPATVCCTATITLSSTTPGGVWTTLTSTTASVGSASGIVTGLAVSSTIPIITYTLPTGCFDTAIVRVTYCAKPEDGGSGSITGNGVTTMRVVPNPNAGAFTISGQLDTADDEQLTIEVTNMLGQVVYSGSTLAIAGAIDAQVQLGKNIANGMYLLTVRSVKEVRVFHIVVEQ